MVDHTVFAAALDGREEQLRDEVGADAIVCVAPELAAVFVVRHGDDGQVGTIGSAGRVADVRLPRTFLVRRITCEGDQFVLTDDRGRTARGTADQFTAWLTLVGEEVNPDYDAQLEAIFLDTHLLPATREPLLESPRADPALAGPEIREAGEALVAVGTEEEVWLDFDHAWPEKVDELLPHARALLADLASIGRTGAEFLWSHGEDDEGRDAFFAGMTPTSLVIYLSGDFAVHYELMSGTEFYLDGYWPVVAFRADRTPVDHYVEA